MQQQLSPFLSYPFSAPIWRMEIDELTDTLVLEIRSDAEKQVHFAAASLTSGLINFDNFITDERWLVGLEAAYDGVALLHFYKHESSPEHKGLIAINVQTAAALWADYSYAFDHLTVNGPVAYNTQLQPKRLLLLDAGTGSVLRKYEAQDKPLAGSIVVPIPAPAHQFAAGSLPHQPYGNIVHYLHHNAYIIVSLHTLKNGVMQQHLYVLNGSNIAYHDVLHSSIQKLQPEAFVLHKNVLLYIKNKTELKAISL